jgi:hypothetical protein
VGLITLPVLVLTEGGAVVISTGLDAVVVRVVRVGVGVVVAVVVSRPVVGKGRGGEEGEDEEELEGGRRNEVKLGVFWLGAEGSFR